MHAYTRLQVIFEGSILEIYLNRPDKRNAIDREMAFELRDVLSHAAANNDVRVVILRGKGPAFCAGADLKFMGRTDLSGEDRPGNVFANLFQAIYRFPKPLVVITHGKAMGGALGLIAAADFALAASDAEFAFSEVRMGLVPATISPYVIKRTGERNARQLMLLGDTFSSERALQTGLIDKTGSPGELENYKSYLCRQFDQNAPQAMMTCKRTIQHVSDAALDEKTIFHTLEVLDKARENPEAQEGMRAFQEKRKAAWQK